MSSISLETEYDAYYPGSTVKITMRWNPASNPPKSLELRLLWNTAGKGTRDLKVVLKKEFRELSLTGFITTEVVLPWGPYSFSGKLISIVWAFELVSDGEKDAIRKEFVMGPQSREVVVSTV